MASSGQRARGRGKPESELLVELRERLRAAIGENNASGFDAEAHVETVLRTLRSRGVIAHRLAAEREQLK